MFQEIINSAIKEKLKSLEPDFPSKPSYYLQFVKRLSKDNKLIVKYHDTTILHFEIKFKENKAELHQFQPEKATKKNIYKALKNKP